MTEKMRRTTDTHTGKRFRWNTTCRYVGLMVPARVTSRDFTCLHPDRVLPALLAKLNPDIEVSRRREEPA